MNPNDQHAIRLLFDDYLRLYAAREVYPIEHFSADFSGFVGADHRISQNSEDWLSTQHHDAPAELPLHIELTDIRIQALAETVALTSASLLIHRSNNAQELSAERAGLVLIFRKESKDWKISHSSLSFPCHSVKDTSTTTLHDLTQHHQMLEEQMTAQAMQLSAARDQLQTTRAALAQTVAEQQRAAEALRKSEAHFRMMTENAVDVVWKLDKDYRFTYISPADEKRRGYSAAEVLGRHVFEMFDEDGIAAIKRAALQRHEAEQRGAPLTDVTFEARHLCKDGSWIWGEICYNPELDAEGKVIGFYGMSRVITERKKMQEQVRQLAFYDPLTTLPNRHLLTDRLDQAMATSKRKGCYGALMFLDLDNFKPINDSHGHIAGDLLLIEVAKRLKQCVREIDTIARFGGDEFIVVLSELKQDQAEAYQQAQSVAEKIRLTLAETYQLTVHYDNQTSAYIEHSCTASIGVALFLGQEISIEDLCKRADNSMYKAKEGGRNAIRFYQPTT